MTRPRLIVLSIFCFCAVGRTVLSFMADSSLRIKGLSSSGTQEFEAGDEMEMTCTSAYEIQWEWPNNSQYKGWSNPEIDGRLVVTAARKIDNIYSTTLKITNLRSTDTGSYICKAVNKQKVLENYVFVKDTNPHHLFLHWVQEQTSYSHLVPYYENLESYIDCLVTHPDAEVELYIRNINTELSGSYDPRKGFFITPYRLAGFSTERGARAKCVATTPNGLRDEVEFLLLGITVSNTIHVELNDTLAKHPYKGGKLELGCIGSGDQSFLVKCNWSFPAHGEHSSKRIQNIISTPTSTKFSNLLIVQPLNEGDSGNYTCTCQAHGTQNSSSVFIDVSPTKGQVELKGQSEKSVSVRAGSRAEFWVEFTVWPAPWSKQWVHNYISPISGRQSQIKNGGDRRASVITLVASPFALIDVDRNAEGATIKERIILQDTTPMDSGEYVISISTADTSRSFNFSLNVRSLELSSELQVTLSHNLSEKVDRRFLQLGNSYSIVCLGTGYPLPHMILQWKPCVVRKRNTCQWEDITGDGRIWDGTFQRALVLRKNVSQSGTYSCIAENGASRSLTPFTAYAEVIVTDIPNSEENEGMAVIFTHKPNGSDGNRSLIYTGDGLKLICQIQKFDYSLMSWYYRETDGIDEFLGDDIQSKSGYDVKYDNSSRYSDKLVLSFASLKTENSGKYRCEAALNPDPIKRVRIYNLNVVETRKPTFESWTSASSLRANYSNQFILKCGATGSPKPSIEWWKDGRKLKDLLKRRQGIVISPNDSLVTITRVVAEDKGLYTCWAANRLGLISRNMTLTVFGARDHSVLSTAGIVILSVCLGLAASIVLVLLVFVCILKRREKRNTALLKDLYDQLMSSAQDGAHTSPKKLDPNKPVNRQAENLPYDRRYELSRNWLRLDQVLGEGQFGRVFSGTLKIPRTGQLEQRYSRIFEAAQPVAVKMPLNGRSLQEQKALLDELKIMIHIGKHVNVLALIGAVTKNMVKGELYVVVELCSLGSLLNYLRSHKATFVTEIVPRSPSSPIGPRTTIANDGYLQPNHMLSEDQQQQTTFYQAEFDSRWADELHENRLTRSFLSTSDLLSFAYQTANGMDFLASKNLIHRDLATRNLLLTEDQTVKIADFGLARQDQTYHIQRSRHVPLPIKWMALESIIHQEFTVKSDMWSFGIVMWELFCLGETPYPAQPLDSTFVTYLKEGNRLGQPTHSPDEIFHLMKQCWLPEPEDRPCFAEAREIIGAQLSRCSPQLFEQLKPTADAGQLFEQPPSEYYNWKLPDYSAPTAALSLNLPKLKGFKQIPQDDPELARLSSSVENQSYMLQNMDPIRSSQSYNTGYINSNVR